MGLSSVRFASLRVHSYVLIVLAYLLASSLSSAEEAAEESSAVFSGNSAQTVPSAEHTVDPKFRAPGQLGDTWLYLDSSNGKLSAYRPIAAPTQEPKRDPSAQPFTGCKEKKDSCGYRYFRQGEQCTWYGTTEIQVSSGKITFKLEVEAQHATPLELPGDLNHWPTEVMADGKEIIVQARSAHPTIMLSEGKHRISGTIQLIKAIETLSVPQDLGLLKLYVDGQEILSPHREAGLLTLLKIDRSETLAEDILRSSIRRRVVDGSPLSLTSYISLQVGGSKRKLNIPNVVLDGMYITTIDASLPVKILEDGSLEVIAASGEYSLRIDGYYPSPPKSFLLGGDTSNSSGNEYWSISGGELHDFELVGATSVDPNQLSPLAPFDPADRVYLVREAGEKRNLEFAISRRGKQQVLPAKLNLHRTVWLNLDGTGYSVSDKIKGNFGDENFLALTHGNLNRISVGEHDELIIKGTEDSLAGIPIREVEANISAEWDFDGSPSTLASSAWNQRFEQIEIEFHVPPGWRLLTAQSSGSTYRDWFEHWSLLDFFLVLLTAFAASSWLGWPWSILLVLTLALCHQEANWALFPWLSLVMLGSLRLKLGELQHWFVKGINLLLRLVIVGLVPMVLYFSSQQLRFALHPQLEESASYDFRVPTDFSAEFEDSREQDLDDAASFGMVGQLEEAAALPQPRSARKSESPDRQGKASSAYGGKLSSFQHQKRDATYSSAAQAGHGLPQWDFNRESITIADGADSGSILELRWLQPLQSRILYMLRSVLALLVLAFVLFRQFNHLRKPKTEKAVSITSLLFIQLAAICVITGGISSSVAHAQDEPNAPSPELSQQQIAPASNSDAECISHASANLSVTPNGFTWEAEVHVAGSGSFPLPGPLSDVHIDRVFVDGKLNQATNWRDGYLIQRLGNGVHRLRVEGRLVGSPVRFIQKLPPKHFSLKLEGYETEGYHNDAEKVTEEFRLIRSKLSDSTDSTDSAESSRQLFPPWLKLSRHFDLGRELIITTVLHRVAGSDEALELEVPMLNLERPAQSGLEVIKGGKLKLRLAAGESSVTVQTRADLPELWELKASQSPRLSEQWTFSGGLRHLVEFAGIPATHLGESGHWLPQFDPYPGDILKIETHLGVAMPGADVAYSDVYLVERGSSSQKTIELSFLSRSNRATIKYLKLPAQATRVELRVDETQPPISLSDNKLKLDLPPGKHQIKVSWAAAGGNAINYKSSEISFDDEISNIGLNYEIPDGRWVLYVSGPDWGPAILFYRLLFMALLMPWGLRKLPGGILGVPGWTVLLLGLLSLPPWLLPIPPLWFFLVGRLRSTSYNPTEAPAKRMGMVLSFLSIAFAIVLVTAVGQGLLGSPDMYIEGAGSSGDSLHWIVDRSAGRLPQFGVISVPIIVWRLLMLLWAFWCAISVVKWGKIAWEEATRYRTAKTAWDVHQKQHQAHRRGDETAQSVSSSAQQASAAPTQTADGSLSDIDSPNLSPSNSPWVGTPRSITEVDDSEPLAHEGTPEALEKAQSKLKEEEE